jgi:hypothetical protein
MDTIILETPVMWGKEEIRDINMRSATAGDFRGIDPAKATMDDMIKIVSRLSGHPESVIEKISIPDFKKLAAVVGNFT